MQYLKDSVREKILKSAIDEFKLHGFADASIRDIAENAGISLGNIYRYFVNKEALYFAVVNPLLDKMKSMVEEVIKSSELTVAQATGKILDFLLNHSDEFLVIRKGSSVHYNTFVNYLVDIIADKVDKMFDGKFTYIEKNVVNPQFSRVISSSFLHALFSVFKDAENDKDREAYVNELFTFYFGRLPQKQTS